MKKKKKFSSTIQESTTPCLILFINQILNNKIGKFAITDRSIVWKILNPWNEQIISLKLIIVDNDGKYIVNSDHLIEIKFAYFACSFNKINRHYYIVLSQLKKKNRHNENTFSRAKQSNCFIPAKSKYSKTNLQLNLLKTVVYKNELEERAKKKTNYYTFISVVLVLFTQYERNNKTTKTFICLW